MDRRSFVISTGVLTSQLLVGCSGNNKVKFNVELLKNSLPAEVVGQFRRTLKPNTEISVTLFEQFQDIFQKLENWQKKPSHQDKNNYNLFEWLRRRPFGKAEHESTDLLTLSDFWLREAIEKKLIQPIDMSLVQQWSALPKQWQELVTRNDKGFVDPQGKIWGAPYRWGNTVIVYHRDRFKRNRWAPPQDWADLWREELRDRISLLNHPREVIGLVLKKLNKSYNTTDLNSVPELESELQKLNQQVKFYGSTKYIEPLLLGDTLLAVGWSQDILPAIARYPYLVAVVPQSGTTQSADVWVSPTGRHQHELLKQWVNFLWQPNIARQIALLTRSHSPIATQINPSDIQEPLRNLLLINPDILKRSEFLLPLPLEVEQQYVNLFERIKNS
ncbi:MAG: extracellular solute-binding protein [Calothrix sp. C42_A2020_038]|nr:extracellular solute-binding protein [Calothrix sp. C42_A2020_038]